MFDATIIRRLAALGSGLTLVAFVLVAGCEQDDATGSGITEAGAVEASDPGGSTASSERAESEVARILDDLRRETAAWHDPEKVPDRYSANLGCIDERVVAGVDPAEARGMGTHPFDPQALDDQVDLLEPETLVYGRNPNSGKQKLAAFDYFIPASETWPAPEDGGEPPVMPELEMPFTWSPAHGGWMFHIWLWWHNPDGTFANFNPTVPTCECELGPETEGGTCFEE